MACPRNAIPEHEQAVFPNYPMAKNVQRELRGF